MAPERGGGDCIPETSAKRSRALYAKIGRRGRKKDKGS